MGQLPGAEETLAQLGDNPEDERLRERAALALTRAGRDLEACALLGEGLINLTAHDGPTLPCLCRRCLEPERSRAEAEGMVFLRRFVVSRGRVLFYWAPEAMADDPGLVAGVRSRLDQRLARSEGAA